MIKTLLVTTDLSAESKLAFPHARGLAQSFQAKVILLAVIEDPAQAAMVYSLELPVFPDPGVHEQVRAKVAMDLKTLCDTHFAGVDTEHLVVDSTGPVAGEIIKVAEEKHADMIVIATHGRTGLAHLVIGSIAERVIRESKCPVLTIPIRERAT